MVGQTYIRKRRKKCRNRVTWKVRLFEKEKSYFIEKDLCFEGDRSIDNLGLPKEDGKR